MKRPRVKTRYNYGAKRTVYSTACACFEVQRGRLCHAASRVVFTCAIVRSEVMGKLACDRETAQEGANVPRIRSLILVSYSSAGHEA